MPQPRISPRFWKYSEPPASFEVAAGTTIVWRNADQLPHTVTADDGQYAVFDEVAVTVQASSGGGGGTVQTFEIVATKSREYSRCRP